MKPLIIKIIKIYKILLSPWIGGNCRFYPSCSDYAIEAIKKKGVIAGVTKAIFRVLRCNPLSRGGWDPA